MPRLSGESSVRSGNVGKLDVEAEWRRLLRSWSATGESEVDVWMICVDNPSCLP
jgi:hypothetical protein